MKPYVQCLATGSVFFALLSLSGCGGGGSGLNAAADRSGPVITRVGKGISTMPTPLTPQGGTATVLVDITDTAGVDPDSVTINVVKQNQVSLLNGPQHMISLNSVQNRWGYQIALPPNSNNFADDVYTVTVAAADMQGNRVNPPFVVGSITVPNH